jgi:TatD DNase family protein
VLIHGFNNKWQVAEKYIKQGYFISLGKSIFNPKQADLIHKIPIEQLFFETDDSEIGIEAIYEKAASLLKIEISDLVIQIQKNGTTLLSNSTLPWKT